MKRKIVQISTDVVGSNVMAIHALCSDGTVWLNFGGEGWNPLEPIPQPWVKPVQNKEEAK